MELLPLPELPTKAITLYSFETLMLTPFKTGTANSSTVGYENLTFTTSSYPLFRLNGTSVPG